MDRFTRMLGGLLEHSTGLLPAARRDWTEALLAERVRSRPGRGGWPGSVGGCGWWHGRR